MGVVLKFLHTADWQLGMVFRQVEDKAESLRGARLDAVKSIVALAGSRAVDFIVVAGDIFEDNRVDHRYVREAAAALRASSVPVYLLPGNHDPLTQDSPFVLHEALFAPPVTVLRRAEPVPILGGRVTLYPCPAFLRTWKGDPTAWIPPRGAAEAIRVGVAHGPLDGTPDQSGYHVAQNAADLRELDYLALGHWHKPMGAARQWYSGTPEPTKFGECSGKVLLVEIDGPRQTPRVEQVDVAAYDWRDVEVEVHGPSDLDHLDRQLGQVESPQRTLVRVRLRGMLPGSELSRIEEICRRHEPRFFWLRLDNDVRAEAQASAWRHPLLRAMYERLAEKAGDGDDAEAARRALSRLATLVADSGHADLS